MNSHGTLSNDASAWDNTAIINAYKEQIAYDANGNIQTYLRNGAIGAESMDNLTYGYNVDNNGRLVNNKLRQVNDAFGATNQGDVGNQQTDNYTYDNIGNLIKDNNEQTTKIDWTVYGKILQINKQNGKVISYDYDATGNRITKSVVSPSNAIDKTFYVRDAQGNVLGVYRYDPTADQFYWTEQHLYGSSRLGMIATQLNIQTSNNGNYTPTNDADILQVGKRSFELTNHLGNVLATVSDKAIPFVFPNSSYVFYYNPDVLTASDYYPFGMAMPGRTYSPNGYRYGFNGKENDKDISEGGQDYGGRIYDNRINKWLSIDPLQRKYPNLSPYNAFANDPINVIDPDGKDIIKIVRITTIYPARASGLDGGRAIGGGVTQGIGYQIIKAPGKDVFFYNTVDVHLSANGGNDKIVAGKPKEFFPNDFQLFGSGITQSDGNIYPLQRVNDIDRITLAKLAPPGLVKALEKKDPNKYGDLRLLSATLAIGEAGREMVGNLLLLEGLSSFKLPSAAGTGVATKSASDFTKLFSPISEFDVTTTLFRGTTGTEKGASVLFLTNDAAVAASYIKNGGRVVQYEVSQFSLKSLEMSGELSLKTGINGVNGAVSTEYMFQGKKVVEALNSIAKPK